MRWALLPLVCIHVIGCALLEPQARAQRDEPRRIASLSLPPAADDREPIPQRIPAHPRLIITESDITRLKRLTREDALARQWYNILQRRAEALVEQPARKDEPSFLRTSRETMLHVTTLAAVYRIGGERRYARRAIEKLLAASEVPDWRPKEFLATAEMSAAFGIGYDWLIDEMSADERTQIRAALIEKGLRAGLDAYDDADGWTRVQHNWNLVCNGGLIIGALAVLDEEPRVAEEVLRKARISIRDGFSAFAPDGGWEEGPSYWTYSTRYAALALAALRTALDTDWGLTRAPGLAETGLFRIYASGPTDLAFNFGDSSPAVGNSAALGWFADVYKRPVYAAFEQKEIGRDVGAFDLLWYKGPEPERLIARLPLDAQFRRIGMFSMRSAWNDPQATYIAFKGGSNQSHHGHLDQGSFVLDALGQRWAIDLGSDNYELEEYFGDKRWTYYRCMTRGHNTITIDNRNQDSRTEATTLSFTSTPTDARAVIDMSRAYRDDARRVQRGVAMLNREQILIQDEIDLSGSADVRWNMHTNAKVEIDGKLATLTQEGQTLTARLLSPSNAKFEVATVNLRPPQEPTPNTRKLYIRAASGSKQIRFAVLFTMGPASKTENAPKIEPLSAWVERDRSDN